MSERQQKRFARPKGVREDEPTSAPREQADAEQTPVARLAIARDDEAMAETRDLAARVRDQAAAARDRAMDAHELAREQHEPVAEYRALAARDRLAAAEDRQRAARDRRVARADREALARALARAETDPLTGARTRAAGLSDLDHELARCTRNEGTLVVAYLDVVGLKALNDTQGHAAGDALLQSVVAYLRTHLRSYDLIIRLGGDEFLCAMTNMTVDEARERFSEVAAALAAAPTPGGIRTGYATLTSDDTIAELIARADHELVAQRQATG